MFTKVHVLETSPTVIVLGGEVEEEELSPLKNDKFTPADPPTPHRFIPSHQSHTYTPRFTPSLHRFAPADPPSQHRFPLVDYLHTTDSR